MPRNNRVGFNWFVPVQSLLLAVALQVPQLLPGLLVERRLSEDFRLSVGDTVEAEALAGVGGGRRFIVEGIFERAADPSRIARNEYEVRFHLPDLEGLLPQRDRVDRFAVALRGGSPTDSVARWIEGLAYGTRAYETATLAEESSATFLVVRRFHDAIAVVTLLASGIFLLCLMVIRVDERRGDIRTLRLIGVSRRTVISAVVIEAAAVAVGASLFGAGLGVLGAMVVNGYFSGVYDTTLRFAIVTPRIVVFSIGVGIALGMAAGVLAALRVTRVPIQRLGER